jgi:hypothetical protein
MMRLVILESPYAGDVEANEQYARECMRDCLIRGEAPYASHLLYTQPGVLSDDIPEERRYGMEAGWAWMTRASRVVVYTDRGISPGMMRGIERASQLAKQVEFRQLRTRAPASPGDEP